MQKLPLSTYSFEKIRNQNQLYVDKTKQMYDLINYSDFVFLSRPRRFGKSLLLNVYAALFEGKKELFKGLWIADKIDWEVYPVIQLNFSYLTHGESKEIFEQSGLQILKRIAVKYEIEITSPTIATYLSELIFQLHRKTGKYVVLLIDEYDKPISDHLTNPAIAERNKEWLRDIFENIKASEGMLRFFMMTGISKFAKMSVFSVLNNIEDITLNERFNDIVGFTEAEIRKHFAAFLPVFAERQSITEEEVMDKIRYWYNGYSWSGQQKIYNPYSVVHVFQRMKFDNFWFESGTPQFLMKLIKEKYAPEQSNAPTVLEFERIQMSTSVYQAYDLQNISLISLLLQTGYLTIVEREEEDGDDTVVLSYPNQEVRLSFSTYLLETFTQKRVSVELSQQSIPLKKALREKNMDLFMTQIKAFFSSIPYVLRKTANEAYYQTVFYALLTSLGFRLMLEKMTDKGRIDTVLELKNVVYVIEFKYSQTGTMDYWLKEGMQQIHKNAYHEQYQGQGKTIFLIAVAFLDKVQAAKKTSNEKRILTIDYLIEK